jgi:excisionase family DNA binding protein
MSEEMVTTREFARQLGVKSTRTILRYVAAKKIVPIRLDGGFRFRQSDIDQFILRRRG